MSEALSVSGEEGVWWGEGVKGLRAPQTPLVGMKCHECDEHTLKPPGWARPAELAWSSPAVTLETTAPKLPPAVSLHTCLPAHTSASHPGDLE